MSLRNCTDCNYVSDDDTPSDGKCSECGGSGYVGFFEGAVRAIATESQECDKCHGSGVCQTCDGQGYFFILDFK